MSAYFLTLRPIALTASLLLGCLGQAVTAQAQPTISVNPTLVPPDFAVTVTVTNSPGNRFDWLALTRVGAPHDISGPIQFVYVAQITTTGATSTWTPNMPMELGQYEFRLYLNGVYTLAATSPTVTVANPMPTIAPPSSVTVRSTAYTLTIRGTNFVSGVTATVRFQPRPVTRVSQGELRVQLQAGDLAGPGTLPIQVTNLVPCIGGICASNTVNLTALSPTPTLTSLSPASVIAAGSAAATLTVNGLTVNGTGFVSGATATVRGQTRAVTPVSATRVIIPMQAGDVATPGTVPVRVTNLAPCVSAGCVSNTMNLTVTAAPPRVDIVEVVSVAWDPAQAGVAGRTVRMQIRNNMPAGSTPLASVPWSIVFSTRTGGTISGPLQERVLASGVQTNVSPGSTFEVTASFTRPRIGGAVDRVIGRVDPGNSLGENDADRANNSKGIEVYPSEPPPPPPHTCEAGAEEVATDLGRGCVTSPPPGPCTCPWWNLWCRIVGCSPVEYACAKTADCQSTFICPLSGAQSGKCVKGHIP